MKSRAYTYKGPIAITKIADKLQNSFIRGNTDLLISSFRSLENALEGSITFLADPAYAKHLQGSKAACIVGSKNLHLLPESTTAIVTDEDARHAKNIVLSMLYEEKIAGQAYIANSAFVAADAEISSNCTIEENCYIGAGARIGENCIIKANSYIGEEVTIGRNTTIYPNVTIIHAKIGSSCVIHAGAAIGQRGFGFSTSRSGEVTPVVHIGDVIIGDNVEVGSNSCIDRGSIESTIIGDNTKIDNLVQIGHNVILGQNCIICGGVGIAGSARIGDSVVIGGASGINGHITIASRCKVAGMSGVTGSLLKEGEVVAGSPAVPIYQWKRQAAILKSMSNKAK